MTDITVQGPAYSILDAKILLPSGSTLVPVDLFYVRQVTVDPQIQSLVFEGDDTSQTIDTLTRIEVTVTCDKPDWDAVQQVFAKTAETTISGESWSLWMGDQDEVAGPTVGFQYDVAAKDESVSPSAAYTLRYTYPLGSLKVVRPQTAEYQAKHVLVLNMSFERTAVDAAGNALTGVPTNGAVYRVARLS